MLQPTKRYRLLLAKHKSVKAVVVDEFGSVVGVLAMEDIIESILGQEIFEYDDIAVDNKELAKRKHADQINSTKSFLRTTKSPIRKHEPTCLLGS